MLEARYPAPEHVPQGQLQVTSQAQVVQAVGALPEGVADRAVDRVLPPQVTVTNDMSSLPLLRPELPDVEVMDDSHIERLLQEQGDLPLTHTRTTDG
jgi:hypothetical protein